MIINVYSGEEETHVGIYNDETRIYTDVVTDTDRPYTAQENAEADERALNMQVFKERYTWL